jgi:DNA-binding NarL/FixJ family response regulator
MYFMGSSTRVVIADGQALIRGGLRALLGAEGDISVAGEAGDGHELVALTEEARPDVVLVDSDLPGLGGLAATRRILANARLRDARVIVLSASHDDDELFAALRAGACGFLAKDTEPSIVIEAVRAVASGESLLSRAPTRRLIDEIASQPDSYRPRADELEELTAREREVLGLVATGLNTTEIAERLVISVATAKTHISHVLRKVDARDRAQLVALAYETGLVQPRRYAEPHGSTESARPALRVVA